MPIDPVDFSVVHGLDVSQVARANPPLMRRFGVADCRIEIPIFGGEESLVVRIESLLEGRVRLAWKVVVVDIEVVEEEEKPFTRMLIQKIGRHPIDAWRGDVPVRDPVPNLAEDAFTGFLLAGRDLAHAPILEMGSQLIGTHHPGFVGLEPPRESVLGVEVGPAEKPPS